MENQDTIARRRGRPATLDRASILGVAGRIPAAEVNMTRLAKELGVSGAALYHYFPHVDAVFEGLAAGMLDAMDLPDPGLDWEEWLRVYAHTLRDAVKASPWAPHLLARPAPVLAGLRHVDAALAVLRRAGFDGRGSLGAIRAVQQSVSSAAVSELTGPEPALMAAHLAASDPDLVANVLALADEIGPLDPDREFADLLDCLLAGIAATHRTRSTDRSMESEK